MSAVCFHEKKEKVAGCDIKLSIWDVGGQTREVEQVCENASCVLFVFDLSRPHTLNSVRRPKPALLSTLSCHRPHIKSVYLLYR